jgi:ubiquinol-cytochrome c reductase subunit 9
MSAWPTPNSTFILFLGVYVTTIFATAFAFGVGFDVGMTSFWDRWNQGVRVSIHTL